MRAVANDNPNLPSLKQLFVRFSGCLSTASNAVNGQTQPNNAVYTTIKKDYIFLEFLKVAKEAILLDMFATFEEASQLTQFATSKFEQEVERE